MRSQLQSLDHRNSLEKKLKVAGQVVHAGFLQKQFLNKLDYILSVCMLIRSPGFADIPQIFNVGLLKGVKWAKLRGIQSSKRIGEPPLFLSASVLFALREAVKAARESVAVHARAIGVVQ